MKNPNLLAAFCDDFLHVQKRIDPWCHNGIQVSGTREIKRLALGTSTSLVFLKKAVKWNADAVLTHHGLFWGKGIRRIDTALAARLRYILENEMTLFSYHLPLDAHEEVGNNAQIAQKLALKKKEQVDIGIIGNLPDPMSFVAFSKKCEHIFGQKIFLQKDFLQNTVSRIGICSGGGAEYAEQFFQHGADTFLTGEISEQHWHQFSEMPMNFIAAGHHATERFGVQALGEILQKQFPEIHTCFFPEPCPV